MTSVLPETFLACFAMGLLLYGAFFSHKRLEIGYLSTLGIFITALLVLGQPQATVSAFNNLFIVNGFIIFMKLLVLIGTTVSLILSFHYIERKQKDRFEFPILMLFATLGMMMMISANHLLSLYIGLEIQSLSLYVLAAFHRDSRRASEAGLKYFVLGALSSGLLLYGTSLVYGYTGTADFQGIAAALDETVSIGAIIGMVFMVAGIGFKLSLAPFHMWTPDVYEGATSEVTAFLAIAPKIAAMALFLRVLYEPFGGIIAMWQQILIFMAVASMLLGAFTALFQTNLKRLLAYSAIGHMGYALLGVIAGTPAGLSAVIVYMTIYLIMISGIFGILLCLHKEGRYLKEIAHLAGLSQTHPLMALAMAIFMFSMIGLPPLAGFFAKLSVFIAAIEAGFYLLVILAVLTSVVAAFYYLRIIMLMYFQDPLEPFFDPPKNDLVVGMIAVMCLGTLLFFVYPVPIVDNAVQAVESLMIPP